MVAIILAWIALIWIETIRNFYLIEIKKKTPKHKLAWLLRVIIGVVFWIVTPMIYHDLELDSWWAMPMMMGFTFWWMFDSGLNLLRRRQIWYLGNPYDPEEDSWMDKLQQNSFGAWPWFWFKLLLAGASTSVFWYGWGAVLG